MSALEIVGNLFALVSIWLTVEENIWLWPTGIVNTALFVVMFYQARLYGDVISNVFMLAVSVYGWWAWLHRGPRRGKEKIRFGTARERVAIVAVCAAASPALGWFLAARTQAALPWWDAIITVLTFVAQALLAWKLVENWLLWIVVDVLSVGVYAAKQLYLTSALYALFLVMCVFGLRRWLRETIRA